MNKVLGDALKRRAGRPTARAMLRCLGYSATIAIAGCSPSGSKVDTNATMGGDESLSIWKDPQTGCNYYLYAKGLPANYAIGGMTIRFKADGTADCPAIATEAHRAATVEQGAVHEGAGRNGIAQGLSQ